MQDDISKTALSEEQRSLRLNSTNPDSTSTTQNPPSLFAQVRTSSTARADIEDSNAADNAPGSAGTDVTTFEDTDLDLREEEEKSNIDHHIQISKAEESKSHFSSPSSSSTRIPMDLASIQRLHSTGTWQAWVKDRAKYQEDVLGDEAALERIKQDFEKVALANKRVSDDMRQRIDNKHSLIDHWNESLEHLVTDARMFLEHSEDGLEETQKEMLREIVNLIDL